MQTVTLAEPTIRFASEMITNRSLMALPCQQPSCNYNLRPFYALAKTLGSPNPVYFSLGAHLFESKIRSGQINRGKPLRIRA